MYSAATVGNGTRKSEESMNSMKRYLECSSFEDTVWGSHPLIATAPRSQAVADMAKEAYNIPYRSLVPIGSKNVLVAGRNISATSRALASTRCRQQPWLWTAAGTAGALCARYNVFVSQLDTGFLRMALKSRGDHLAVWNCG